MKTLDGYNPHSRTLRGPYASIGSCLVPFLPRNAKLWIDWSAPIYSRDVCCHVILHNATKKLEILTKILEATLIGRWYIVADGWTLPLDVFEPLFDRQLLQIVKVVAFDEPAPEDADRQEDDALKLDDAQLKRAIDVNRSFALDLLTHWQQVGRPPRIPFPGIAAATAWKRAS